MSSKKGRSCRKRERRTIKNKGYFHCAEQFHDGELDDERKGSVSILVNTAT